MFYFIVNENGASGKGALTWALVTHILEDRRLSYKRYISQGAGHATKIARHICDLKNDDDKKIVVVGGDGTVNEVLNGISDFEHVSFGLIPTGSGNDFARGMKIPKITLAAIEKIVNSKGDKKMDLGLVHAKGFEERVFAISAGCGLDALVCKKVDSSKLKKVLNKIHLGSLTYIILTVVNLFSMTTSNCKIYFDDEEGMEFKKQIFFAGMNCPTEGGGVKMAPGASVFDGQLSACMAYGVKKIFTFFKLPLLAMGKHGKLKGFFLKNFSKVKIISDKKMVVHADGEYAGESDEVEISCKKNCLRVLI